ncbi:MAG: hypothetical protein ETSY2_47055 [Candidatus Entotheonella gemina]|uniref:Uncharacterized protein n=1 Tax=Candidatus Entotheonella gemina TaxID=1429439 RepID=W4LDR5_9BACT|nr:MAG: hypothetical protein ETSY2_47055 [Candidatus Entotheonella gemina]
MADNGIPANISKGPGHVAIDAELNYQEDGKYVRRPAIRAALENSGNSYIDLLRSVFKVPERIIEYVETHWYPEDITAPPVWWKDKQPIEPLFRQSLIEAIDLAGDLPIDSYWMPIGSRNVDWRNVPLGIYRPDEYPFEIIMAKSEKQLTRLIVTPPTPRPQNVEARYTEPADIWVVKSKREVQPFGETRFEPHDVAVTQLKEIPYRRGYRGR